MTSLNRRNLRSSALAALLAPLLLAPAAALAGGGPPAPPPAPPPGPGAPADDAYAAGERAVDEAMRWIAKGETPATSLQTMYADIDYSYDDGSMKDERRMELWYRNPDAFRANFEYQGRPSTFLLVGSDGYLIRDIIRVDVLNNHPTMGPKLMPMLQQYRDVLQEVGRLIAPKSPGARFHLDGVIPNPAASGGQWFKVTRTAPREPNMTYYFGAAPRKDGGGLRAIAPDRLIIAGEPGSNYQGDDYRLEDWARDDPQSQREKIRYPRRIRLYAIGIDPENKPTMRASVNAMDLNPALEPELFQPRGCAHPRPLSARAARRTSVVKP